MQRNEVTKHLGNIRLDVYVDVLEILRFALDDKNNGALDDKNKGSLDDKIKSI